MGKPLAYLGMALSVFFVVVGVSLPFYQPATIKQLGLANWQLYMFAFVIAIYGIFRFWRSYKLLKRY